MIKKKNVCAEIHQDVSYRIISNNNHLHGTFLFSLVSPLRMSAACLTWSSVELEAHTDIPQAWLMGLLIILDGT